MTPEDIKARLHKFAASLEFLGPMVALEFPATGAEMVQAGQAIDAIPLSQIQTIFAKVQSLVDLGQEVFDWLKGNGFALTAKWVKATGA